MFWEFTSFTFPTTIYRYDLAKRTSAVFRAPEVKFDPQAYETEQVFFPSKDGTRLSVEFTIVPFTGEAGRMDGIAAIIRDVTAKFEEARDLRRQLAALSGKSPA